MNALVPVQRFFNLNSKGGVLKTKTPKTLKLENKDPPYFGGYKITTSRSPMRQEFSAWNQDIQFTLGCF